MIKTEMPRVHISLSANSAVFLQQGVQRAEVPTPASCHRTPVLCSPLRFICKFYYFECKVTLMSMRAHMLRARRNRLNSSMSQQQHARARSSRWASLSPISTARCSALLPRRSAHMRSTRGSEGREKGMVA